MGIPIGNLTSQIFANIYLNELDRFVVHTLKPRHYLRYGDDFLIFESNKAAITGFREQTITFLREKLQLAVNPKHDIIVPATKGLYFLGVEIYPSGRRLRKRNWQRVKSRMNSTNIPSYSGFVLAHSNEKRIKEFNWRTLPYTDTID